MFGWNGSNNSNNESARRGETSMTRGVANISGIAAAFFASPVAFDWTNGFIEEFTAERYGDFWVEIVSWAWFGLIVATAFFATRLFVSDRLAIQRIRSGRAAV